MKKIKKIKTGFFSRHLTMAKMLSGIGKDIYFSDQKSVVDKIGKALGGKAEGLSGELAQLKGSFLKAGQLLSLYAEDLLPPEVENLFKKLQSQSSYLEWEQISQQIPSKLLKELDIEKEPFAAASIGQVHKAVDQKGKVYALKIQYKDIDKVIDMDLRVLRWIVKGLKVIPHGLNLDSVFDEIRAMLLQEMDYEKEATLTKTYRKMVGDQYIVPKVYKKYSSKKVLCLEFIDALPVEKAIATLSQKRRNMLAKDFFELFFKEIFVARLIQSDSHLGNYLIKGNKWVLLDFGATKEVSEKVSNDYERLINSIVKRDRDEIWNLFNEADIIDWERTDESFLWDYILLISEPFVERKYNWGKSDISKKAMNMGRKLHSSVKLKYIPHDNIFIDRKIGGLFYMLKVLNANGDIVPREYLDL